MGDRIRHLMAERTLTVTVLAVNGEPAAEQGVSLEIEGAGRRLHSSDDGTVCPTSVTTGTDSSGVVTFTVRPSAELTPVADYVARFPYRGVFVTKTFTMPDFDINLRDPSTQAGRTGTRIQWGNDTEVTWGNDTQIIWGE